MVCDVIDGKRVLGPPQDIREVKNAYDGVIEYVGANRNGYYKINDSRCRNKCRSKCRNKRMSLS